MTITASTRPSGTVGQAPVLVLSGSAAISVRVDLVAGIPSVLVDGQALSLAGIGPVSGVDAGGISGPATLWVQDDGRPMLLTGSPGADTLSGGAGNDTLSGAGGGNLLDGGAGDDIIVSSWPAFDTVVGGDGFDTAYLHASIPSFSPGARNLVTDTVSENLLAIEIAEGGSRSLSSRVVRLESVERIIFDRGPDLILTHGTDADDVLIGAGDAVSIIAGNAGHDSVTGGNLADELLGGAGNDTLRGGAGNDVLSGGSGRNLLDGGAGQDTAVIQRPLSNGLGLKIAVRADAIHVNDVAVDQLVSIEAVKVIGTTAADTLIGGDGGDSLIGGLGNDLIDGGRGDDRIYANGGADTLTGGSGNDVFVIGGGGTGRVTITDFKPGDRIAFNGPASPGEHSMPISRWEVGSRGEGFGSGSVALEQIAGGVRFHAFMDNVAGADYTVDVLGNFTLAGWRAGVGASYSEVEFVGSIAKPVEGPVGTDSEDIITGGAGRDLLVGKGADDLLNGGAGVDAASFTGNMADYVIAANANGSYTVTDRLERDGADSLTDIELLRFADRIVPLGTIALQPQAGTAQVDEMFYRSRYSDIAQAIQIGTLRSGAEHFARYGQAEGRQPNAYSDAQGRIYSEFWYLATNSDVAAAVDRGQFDSGYEHYVRFGKAEGRGAFPAGRVPDIDLMFDAASYLSANPDLRGTPWSLRPYEHFLLYGFSEGRDPNLFFDVDWYLDRNPDVAAGIRLGLVGSAIEHYSRYGWREGRDPSAAFDISAYQDRYPDIRAAGVDPMLHYLGWGFAEGRVVTAADTAWIG